MQSDRHITWENFRQSFIEPGVPAAHPISGNPDVRFFVSDDAENIGIRIKHDGPGNAPDLMLEQIDSCIRYLGQEKYLEVSTDKALLFEQFYAVMVNIADLVQLDHLAGIDAAGRAIAQFRSLLEQKSTMSEDRIVGLWGELWVLKRLLGKHGLGVLNTWKGPEKGIHDFRLGEDELEVKTTRNEDRKHIISRLSQLEPSPDMSLFIVSLQVVPTDQSSGDSLLGLVRSITDQFSLEPEKQEVFSSLLGKAGYDSDFSHYYTDRYVLRSSPALIPVNADCPRVTWNMVEHGLGKDLSQRISDVKYRVDLTGLGYEQEHAEFKRVL